MPNQRKRFDLIAIMLLSLLALVSVTTLAKRYEDAVLLNGIYYSAIEFYVFDSGQLQERIAETKQKVKIAQSRQLSVESISHQSDHPDLALLLSLAAYKKAETAEAKGSLLSNLQQASPFLKGFLFKHRFPVEDLLFEPHGNHLYSVDESGLFIMWDLALRKSVREFYAGDINAAFRRFSPNAKWLGVISEDNTVKLWDVDTGNLVYTFIEAGSKAMQIAFNSTSSQMAVGHKDGSVAIWDLSTVKIVANLSTDPPSQPTFLGFSPSDKYLAAGQWDHTVNLWDMTTYRLATPALAGHSGYVVSVAFSPDEKTLASVDQRGVTRTWDLTTLNEQTPPLGYAIPQWPLPPRQVTDLAYNLDGKTLIASNGDNSLTMWDVTKPICLPGDCDTVPTTTLDGPISSVTRLRFAPDGETFASGDENGAIFLWSSNLQRQFHETLPAASSPILDIDPPHTTSDGRMLIRSGGGDVLTIWDNVYQRQLMQFSTGFEKVSSLALDNDGGFVALGSGHTITVWKIDIYSDQATQIGQFLIDNDDEATSLAFNRGGRQLAIGSNGKVVVMDIPSGTPISPELSDNFIPGVPSFITNLEFSSESHFLAAASENGTSVIWDRMDWRRVGDSFKGTRLRFSKDGALLATGGLDITLWDVETARPIGVLSTGRNEGDLLDLEFSSSGDLLAYRDNNNKVNLWNVNPNDWVKAACELASRNLTKSEWAHYVATDEQYVAICEQWPIESP